MSALQPPPADAPPEEWGAFAVSIPGWRWMLGMGDMTGLQVLGWVDPAQQRRLRCWHIHMECVGTYLPARLLPDPDDPATAGCLLALYSDAPGWHWVEVDREKYGYRLCSWMGRGHTVKRGPLARSAGRACIAAAAALGRWPGGDS